MTESRSVDFHEASILVTMSSFLDAVDFLSPIFDTDEDRPQPAILAEIRRNGDWTSLGLRSFARIFRRIWVTAGDDVVGDLDGWQVLEHDRKLGSH